MSIESLCSAHAVDILLDLPTVGATMGVAYNQSTVATNQPCNVQRLSAGETTKYGVRGMAVSHKVYFSTDPSLTTANVLKFGNVYLRVRGVFSESDGTGADQLWVVVCDQETSRKES